MPASVPGGAESSPRPAPLPVNESEPVPGGYVDRGQPVPERYSYDRLVALVRDPQWIFLYWELDGAVLEAVRARRGQQFVDACAWVLRIYRVDEGLAEDIEVAPASGNWYLQVGRTGRYQFELALLSPEGEWVSLLVSQAVATPREAPSDVVDAEWRLRPEDEELLSRMAAGLADARQRGGSGFLGASRVISSFAVAGSLMLRAPGSWAWSFQGASVRGASAGSGGFGWMTAATGALEPMLDRPMPQGGGPNWNTQGNLPGGGGKTQQPHFKVKLPRLLRGVTPPAPTWPPGGKAGVVLHRKARPARAKTGR
jgi:hypothetical protein